MPNADQDVDNKLGGRVEGSNRALGYQFRHEAGGRTTLSSDDKIPPYKDTLDGQTPIVGSAAVYDQIASTVQFQGSRHVDPFGNLVTQKKAFLVQWYWMLDGCPTPLSRERFLLYVEKANGFRPWPQTAVAAWNAQGYQLPAGETSQDYSKVDPNATLDSLT